MSVTVSVPYLCAIAHLQALRKDLHTRHITALRTTEFAQVRARTSGIPEGGCKRVEQGGPSGVVTTGAEVGWGPPRGYAVWIPVRL